MKKKANIITVIVLFIGVVFFLGWVAYQDFTREEDGEKYVQNVKISSVVNDVDDFEVEVSVVQAKGIGETPKLEVFLENNTTENFTVYVDSVYYRDNSKWRELQFSGAQLLEAWSILCPESVALLREQGNNEGTNTLELSLFPWNHYYAMNLDGEYRLELYVGNEETEYMVIFEWTQKINE